MSLVINAQKLFKRYPGFAPVLRGADLQVEPGEMAAVMGPSGCGKSTMLHILGLLHAPDSGSLDILGVNALALSREQISSFRRANLGFVMQASNLFEHSTVFENVEFPLIYENVPPQERWERVIRALELVRLSARVHYPGNRLSGGEQQRVAIARAMVNNPRILLADEPTGALDARTSRLIMENFRNLCHKGGVSMVMVTHDPAMAEFCDSTYMLEDGLLVRKKHLQGPYTENVAGSKLHAPEPVVSGAMVTGHFPGTNPDLAELARRLYTASILSRICALFSHLLHDNSAGYALPLPVRRMNFFTRLFGLRIFWKRARGSASLWQLWRQLPARPGEGIGLRKRILAFLSGAILARWALHDNIRFFFAASAGLEATAAWVAAALLRVPFAFQVQPQDLERVSPNWNVKGGQAAFVTCPSQSVLERAKTAMPLVSSEKFILAYPLPIQMPADDDADAPQAREPSSHTEIVATGPDFSLSGYAALLSACKILKDSNVSFRLGILGKVSRKQKKQAEKAGLKLEMVFLGKPKPDTVGESFKTADIFVNAVPDNNAEKLILPIFLREALAYGVAIVCQGMSAGAAEILKDGQNCLASSQDNARALADNLLLLCRQPARRRELGQAGRKDLASLLDQAQVTRKLADLAVLASAADKPDKDSTQKR